MSQGNAEVADLVRQFEAIVADARNLAGPMSDEGFNRQPAAGRWSPGQCLEHLNMTERGMLENMRLAAAEVRSGARPWARPTRHGWLMGWFIGVMEPPVKWRAKTSAAFAPTSTLSKDAVLGEFVRLHDDVRAMLQQVDGYDLGVKIRSPFSKYLKYKLGSAFALMAAHDRRHLWQAREAAH